MFRPKPAGDPFHDNLSATHYRYELWRLLSFVNYPRSAPQSSLSLARQGFIYIGNGNADATVMCVFCSLVLSNLDKAVNIEDTHRTLKPNCATWREEQFRNIPLNSNDKESTHFFSQLHSLQNTDPPPSSRPTSDVGSCEAQVLPLEVDTPEHTIVPATILSSDDVPNLASDHAHHTSNQRNIILSPYCVHSQATNTDHASEMVTNRASTLSFPHQGASQDQESLTGSFREVSQIQARPDGQPLYSEQFQSNNNDQRDGHDFPRTQDGDFLHNQHDDHDPVSGRDDHDDGFRHDEDNSHDAGFGQDQHDGLDQHDGQDQHDGNNQDVGQSQQGEHRGTPSYEKIGIMTSRPKRPEYALELARLQSFENWPKDHHIKPEDLVKAGFFYTGSGDCVRCFNCGGGLRNWELGDDVWVEHARWFFKCSFIKQKVGNAFINIVQSLEKEQEIILYEDVIRNMRAQGLAKMIPAVRKEDQAISDMKKDTAVKLLIDFGFREDDVIKAALNLKAKGFSTAVDLIYEELPEHLKANPISAWRLSNTSECVRRTGDAKKDQETIKSLQKKRTELRDLSLCKVCLDKEVSVVFLPCGHFISCIDCSFVLRSCPVCRMDIKGVIHASIME